MHRVIDLITALLNTETFAVSNALVCGIGPSPPTLSSVCRWGPPSPSLALSLEDCTERAYIAQEVLESTNQETFAHLADFAVEQHQEYNPAKRISYVAAQRLIPTALTVAGGVNSADHARTFPDLVALLKSKASPAYRAASSPSL